MNDANSASANVGPGDKIAGYQLEEQVGQGGMAVVYRARDERLDRQVALKVMAPARVWNIAGQVADALDTAHGRNLIHRDVKPANILIDVAARSTSGRIDHVYLTDFGVSMHGVTSHLTGTGHFVGSLAYISPEQIEAR